VRAAPPPLLCADTDLKSWFDIILPSSGLESDGWLWAISYAVRQVSFRCAAGHQAGRWPAGVASRLSSLECDEVEVLVEHLGLPDICALRGAAGLARDEALQGHLRAPAEAATWVLAQPARKACLAAARQGQLDRLRLAMRHGCEFDYYNCLEAAAMATRLDALHWLLHLAYPPSPFGTRDGAMRFAMAGAARSGRHQAMQLIYAQCPDLSRRYAEVAARGGHLEVLQWMHAHGFVPDEATCAAAAYAPAERAIAALQWLRQVGCPWDQRTCAAAAGQGDLPLLKWLRDPERAPPCPWDDEPWSPGAPRESEACQAAAEEGHDEVLQWLRSAEHPTPCPWHEEYVTRTHLHRARDGDFDPAVLRWLRSQVESPHALRWLTSFCD